MPLFMIYALDKPGSLAARLAARPAHLEHVNAHRGQLRFAGPLLDEAGEMNGSLLIFEGETEEAARAFAEGDPYAQAGLFERVEIRSWRQTIPSPS
jgi:uncharacterized protein YciI